MVYLHPILGIASVALLFYAASLGIRSRGRARHRAALLMQHARLAPVLVVAVLVSWASGFVSTLWLRDDLDLAGSSHFRVGGLLAVTLLASWRTSRAALAGSDGARDLHVWLGVAAVLLAAAQAFTGLRITP